MAETLPPMLGMLVTMATLMSEAIMAYSMAVAPESSCLKTTGRTRSIRALILFIICFPSPNSLAPRRRRVFYKKSRSIAINGMSAGGIG